jgi:excisionase family DNA binding protein
MAKPEALYTVEEAADYLKVKPNTVRQWLRLEKLPGVKIGSVWRIREEDLEAFLAGKPAEA